MKIVSIYIDKERVIFGSDERVPKWNPNPIENQNELSIWKGSIVRFKDQTKSKFKVVHSDGSVGNLLFAFVDNQESCFNIPRPIECEVIMSDDMGLPNTNQRLLSIKESTVKEESQEELWRSLIDIYDTKDRETYGYGGLIQELQKHFTITRK